ncbi:OsmC family protein [Gordonia spumicola]|uniref:OsmC family protein n=1 Tax=Gordonia spumicola TaxID=589161 RepID=UPI0035306992
MPDSGTELNTIAAQTANAVAANPANAAAVFAASATAGEGVSSQVGIRSFSVTVDEPPVLGGRDTAPNPVEFYLASLLSCQVVTYRFWAERLGVTLDSLALHAEGDLDVRGFFGLDDDVRPGFTQVRVTVDVAGPDAPERYRELHDIVDKHCPVLDLTVNQTPVTTDLRIADA